MAVLGRRVRRWGLPLLLLAVAVLFLWLGVNTLLVSFVWRQYPATVEQCFGGRNNLCDVAIRAAGTTVRAQSYVGSNHHSGDHVVVVAPGQPPWGKVQTLDTGLRWLFTVAWLGVGIAALAGAAYLAFRSPRARDQGRHSTIT
jgi:hypothetical protein